MYDRTQAILQKSGLNKSETQMFQALLSVGEETPLKEVIAHLNMTEFTGYRTARMLADRGLAEIIKQGRLKFIKALPLEKLARKVSCEQRRLRRLELDLQSLAKQYTQPEFKGQNSPIKIFEGREKCLDLYDTLPEKFDDKVCAFGSMNSLWEVIGYNYYSPYEKNWVKRRVKNRVRLLMIDLENSVYDLLSENNTQELREIRLVSNYLEPKQIALVDKSKAYIFDSQCTPKIFEINNRALVESLKYYFRFLWGKSLKPVKK